ncbi:cingulin-like [Asparagus officinalis]|uniref:cingulin-like n=1 Tax=Asparagus officinalis TaxID=4686 RepID=UPI00098E1383|nr:cingulin-like [Asparagus officinalis]
MWYLDTGASNHMCGHKHLFVEMQKIEDGHVLFGDASKVRVKGRGKICFLQKDNKEGSIENVYYVPDLKSNILSMGQLLEKGYSVFMKDRMLHLKDKKDRLLAHVEMAKNRMFKLNLRNVQERCLQINMEDVEKEKEISEKHRAEIKLIRVEIDVEKEKEISEKHRAEIKLIRVEIKEKVIRIESLEKEGRRALARLERDWKDKEEGLGVEIIELEEKKKFELKIRIVTLELEESKKKIEEISREKNKSLKEKAKQEMEILELKSEQNTRLLSKNDAIKKEVGVLEEEAEAKIGELTMKLDGLSSKIREISMEKDKFENVKTKQDVDIILRRRAFIQDERDTFERELDVRREEWKKFLSQVHELKKSKDECLRELEELNASTDALVLEKEKEKSIMMKKMKDSEVVSDKVLSLLKTTTKAVHGGENAQENGFVDDDDDDDRICPFAEEMERIK